MGQYTNKGFYMEIKNEEDLDFAKRYTKSICEPYNGDLFELSKKISNLRYKNNKFFYSIFNTTEDIELSKDEADRLIGCICVCDKIKMNNWARYCDKNCPYYFNTKKLQKILLGIE